MKKYIALLLTALFITSSAFAATLGVGDPAPELKVSKWVKGDAIESMDPAKTYVVEFWATWCPPCLRSIPHLTELAKKHPSVTFIGMDVWERTPDPTDKVEQFVKNMGDKMQYNVALDTKDQFMAKHWMTAAEQDGIPTAFLVQNGIIVWIGHPMSGLAEVVAMAETGAVDVAAIKSAEEKRKKTGAALEHYARAVLHDGDASHAAESAAEIEALDISDADMLNAFAWFLLTDKRVAHHDLPFITRLAKKAVDLSESKQANILDTYARALHDGGSLSAAIEVQRQAIAIDPADQELAQTLEEYLAEATKTPVAPADESPEAETPASN